MGGGGGGWGVGPIDWLLPNPSGSSGTSRPRCVIRLSLAVVRLSQLCSSVGNSFFFCQ